MSVILGQYQKQLLQAHGQFGAIVIAPPRTGKGVSFGIPNGLNFPGSLFVIDIKGESYQETSGYRGQHGQEIIRFDPLSGSGHSLNPLDKIPRAPETRTDAIQMVTYTLLPDNEKKGDIWAPAGRNLMTAIIHYLIDTEQPCHIGEVLSVLRGTDSLIVWADHVLKEHGEFMDTQGVASLRSFLQMRDAPKQLTGVISTLETALALWTNPHVVKATSRSDFDPANMRRRATSFYICINPSDIARLAPLMNLILQQTLQSLLTTLPDTEEEPYQILALFDEMTAFNKMPFLMTSIGYIVSYNIILVPMVQSYHQLISVYGKEDAATLLDTSQYQIFFDVNDLDTATELSKRLGMKTVMNKSRSRPSGLTGWLSRTSSQSINEQAIQRPLMSPDEIMRMPPNDILILARGHRPIRANKLCYYTDKRFKPRVVSLNGV